MELINSNSTVKLNNGLEIPILGLGVWKAESGNEVKDAIKWAIKDGYKLLDTAKIYGNEKSVGEAIKESGVKREDLFVTTKLFNTDQGYDNALNAFDKSLSDLDLDYVDLYLIHFPVAGLRKDSWKALEEIYDSKRAKAIGVSNYTINHLKELMEYSSIMPAVNQVEFHVFLYQKELLEFCKQHKIQLQAYSPLISGERINDPDITKIAEKYNKSNAQILIRWCLQHDVITIPKSVKEERIKENINVFDFNISKVDMDYLDSLGDNIRVCWDPTGV